MNPKYEINPEDFFSDIIDKLYTRNAIATYEENHYSGASFETWLEYVLSSVYNDSIRKVRKHSWRNLGIDDTESEQYYKNGDLDGLAIRWHENGNKKSEVHYKNGELEGFGTIWYENGNMKVAEFYIDGEREGWQVTWDERGNKKSVIYYQSGEEGDGIFWSEV